MTYYPELLEPGGVASLAAQVSVSASATETLVLEYEIPANTLRVGTTYRIHASGSFDNPSDASPSNPVWRFRVGFTTLGGTEIQNNSGNTPTSTAQANREWDIDALLTLRSIGASGTIKGASVFLNEIGTTAQGMKINTIVAPVAIDTTVARKVGLTMQLGEGTAGYVLRCEIATIELVKV
jgi:hypothetical protein